MINHWINNLYYNLKLRYQNNLKNKLKRKKMFLIKNYYNYYVKKKIIVIILK